MYKVDKSNSNQPWCSVVRSTETQDLQVETCSSLETRLRSIKSYIDDGVLCLQFTSQFASQVDYPEENFRVAFKCPHVHLYSMLLLMKQVFN